MVHLILSHHSARQLASPQLVPTCSFLFFLPFAFFLSFGSCLMVSHHKPHWQALSRMGSAWETGLSGGELYHLPGDELPPSRGRPWTGGFLVLPNLGHRGNLYSSPKAGKSRCLIYKEISVRCV